MEIKDDLLDAAHRAACSLAEFQEFVDTKNSAPNPAFREVGKLLSMLALRRLRQHQSELMRKYEAAGFVDHDDLVSV